jgi:hypothetical protein
VNNERVNPDGKKIDGCTEIQGDGYIINGWYDEIPDLNQDFPNLYMTYRKKRLNTWGYFSKPVLWNKYTTNLELLIDNDQIIIDDNSDATTLQNLSLTTV